MLLQIVRCVAWVLALLRHLAGDIVSNTAKSSIVHCMVTEFLIYGSGKRQSHSLVYSQKKQIYHKYSFVVISFSMFHASV